MTTAREDQIAAIEELEAACEKAKANEDLAYSQGRLDAQAEMAPRIKALEQSLAYSNARFIDLMKQITKNAALSLPPVLIVDAPLPAPPYNAAIDDVGAIPNSVRLNT